MEPKQNYFIVGLFTLTAIAALIFFAVWLTGIHETSKYTRYRIFFSQSVNGLSNGSAVKYRGVDVGRIRTIAIDRNNPERIKVTIEVGERTPIKQDTVATLRPQGVTGLVFIELTGGNKNSPPLEAPEGKIAEIPSQPSQLEQIVNFAPQILDKVNDLATRANLLLSDQNIEAFSQSLESMRAFSATLEKNSAHIDATLANIAVAMQNLSQTASTINGIATSSRGDMQEFLAQARASSEQLSAFLEKTNEFSRFGFSETQAVLQQLKKTLRDLDNLSISLKENPSQLLRGAPHEGVTIP